MATNLSEEDEMKKFILKLQTRKQEKKKFKPNWLHKLYSEWKVKKSRWGKKYKIIT